MTFGRATVLAVIPARGGSKGIAKKNLREVGGVSLVGRAILAAQKTECIDRIVCSTDDPEIAAEAERFGVAVPDLRPAEFATDQAKSVDAWRHAWLDAERRDQCLYDISVLLEPTSPLRRPSDIETTIAALSRENAAAAATVSRTPGHYTPQKTLTISSGRIGFYLADGGRFARRQDIPAYFHRNGICYATRRTTVVESGTIIERDCVPVVIERPVVNIDDPLDLEIAEMLCKTEKW